jgi:hypothetical protein
MSLPRQVAIRSTSKGWKHAHWSTATLKHCGSSAASLSETDKEGSGAARDDEYSPKWEELLKAVGLGELDPARRFCCSMKIGLRRLIS